MVSPITSAVQRWTNERLRVVIKGQGARADQSLSTLRRVAHEAGYLLLICARWIEVRNLIAERGLIDAGPRDCGECQS